MKLIQYLTPCMLTLLLISPLNLRADEVDDALTEIIYTDILNEEIAEVIEVIDQLEPLERALLASKLIYIKSQNAEGAMERYDRIIDLALEQDPPNLDIAERALEEQVIVAEDSLLTELESPENENEQ